RASAAPVKRRSTPAAAVAGAEARREPGRVEGNPAKKRRSVSATSTDLPGSTSSSNSEPAPREEKAPAEKRASAAPVKRRSTRAAAVAGAEARREPGRVEGNPAKKRRSVSATSTDLPGSTSSSNSEPAPSVEGMETPKEIGKDGVADLP